jgi:hypothetical protein
VVEAMSGKRAVQRRMLLRASLGFALLEFPRGREPAEIGGAPALALRWTAVGPFQIMDLAGLTGDA